MTNEELVLEYQQGNQDAIEELWLQVRGFITTKAIEYLKQFPAEHQSLKDDLIQQSFFSLLHAAERFDSDRGTSFLTYFGKCIPSAFHEVIFSGTGSRLEHEPLNNALSLEQPLYENDDGSVVTLADTIADKLQGEQTEYVTSKGHADVESDDFWRSVNAYMKECFEKYGTEMGAAILSYMLDHDCTFRDAVLALYNDDIRISRKIRSKYEYHKKQTESKFKQKWKADKEQRRKLMLDELFIGSHGLKDSGFSYFKHTGMSSVERAVIDRSKYYKFK